MEFIAALILLPCQSLSLPYIGIPRWRRVELYDTRNTMGDNSQAEDKKPLRNTPTTDGRAQKQLHSASRTYKERPPNNVSTSTSIESSPKSEPTRDSKPPLDENSMAQNPLFPPLPSYNPSTTLHIKSLVLRPLSFVSTLTCLGILGFLAACKTIGSITNYAFQRMTLRNPDKERPFYEEERKRKIQRAEEEKVWKKKPDTERDAGQGEFIPTEGGPDPIVCDVSYYARRVGLDVEFFKVQTEDGFIIDLWHVYDPAEYAPLSKAQRAARGPEVWNGSGPSRPHDANGKKPKFPVLLIHGLLQSSGTFCVNDDDSLAFFLCKAGYDVWLGNNRCGFTPEHATLQTTDPRMWSWTPREMGILDLPALTSRVLSETGFEKLGLISHSQGTTQTFIALSKDQRPELGEKLSVFCALAPAVYAGPLIKRFYFKFISLLTPRLYYLVFGIHAFIPVMMTVHRILPGHLYGLFGYRMYHYLFNWSDTRWDRGLRDRMFQFAPVYVSAESMKWWLGRDCFAKHKCVLSTREENLQEEKLDKPGNSNTPASSSTSQKPNMKPARQWYNEQVPPFAIWATGSDDLVDGRKLLNRFNRGREPHVRIVHQKVIEEYEHLDVVWAMDAIEQVGREVRDVLWMTCPSRNEVRVPKGCEEVDVWIDPKGEKMKEVV